MVRGTEATLELAPSTRTQRLSPAGASLPLHLFCAPFPHSQQEELQQEASSSSKMDKEDEDEEFVPRKDRWGHFSSATVKVDAKLVGGCVEAVHPAACV